MPPCRKKNTDTLSSVLANTGTHITPTMAEFLEKEELSQNALIGYACTDILDRKITFRCWNRCQENKDEVKELVDSFMQNRFINTLSYMLFLLSFQKIIWLRVGGSTL